MNYISSGIVNVLLGLSMLMLFSFYLLNIHRENIEIIQGEWQREYDAHACGRAIVATAMIEEDIRQRIKHKKVDKSLGIKTISYIRSSLVQRFYDRFKINFVQCIDLKSSIPVAELILLNPSQESSTKSHYGYRLKYDSKSWKNLKRK